MRNIYYFFVKCWNSIKCIFCTYVFTGQYTSNRNFGDALGILMPKLFGVNNGKCMPKRYVFDWIYRRGTNLQMVGSTLGDVNENSILCGAGAISINQRIRNKPYKIISVRGPLTRELCIKQGIDCPPVYGDPAMLLPLFYNPRPSTYIHTGSQKVGLIPHYVDKENGIVKQLAKNQEIHVIDILLSPNKFGKMSVENEWKKWIDELCSCDCVISSSLHGLIIAEAYGIPTLWVKFSDEINGDDFKFYDYYASIGLSVSPLDLREKEIGFEELQGLITYKDISIIDKKEYLQTLKMSINILFP